jgi:hypothetical protein
MTALRLVIERDGSVIMSAERTETATKEAGDVRLVICRLPRGGYVVSDIPMSAGMMRQDLYASTNIDDALAFIKGQFAVVRKLSGESP